MYIYSLYFYISYLTLSAQQTKTNTCANSVDQDEMAHNEPSGSTLCHSVIDFWVNPYLQQWMCPNLEMEEFMSNSGGEKVKLKNTIL